MDNALDRRPRKIWIRRARRIGGRVTYVDNLGATLRMLDALNRARYLSRPRSGDEPEGPRYTWAFGDGTWWLQRICPFWDHRRGRFCGRPVSGRGRTLSCDKHRLREIRWQTRDRVARLRRKGRFEKTPAGFIPRPHSFHLGGCWLCGSRTYVRGLVTFGGQEACGDSKRRIQGAIAEGPSYASSGRRPIATKRFPRLTY